MNPKFPIRVAVNKYALIMGDPICAAPDEYWMYLGDRVVHIYHGRYIVNVSNQGFPALPRPEGFFEIVGRSLYRTPVRHGSVLAHWPTFTDDPTQLTELADWRASTIQKAQLDPSPLNDQATYAASRLCANGLPELSLRCIGHTATFWSSERAMAVVTQDGQLHTGEQIAIS